MTLNSLKTEQKAIIAHVNACGAVRQRLFDMGILPNVAIEKERAALGGDPIWVRVQGVQIALRKTEAETIEVLL